MKHPMTQTMNNQMPVKDDNDSETVTDEMKPVDKMNSYK